MSTGQGQNAENISLSQVNVSSKRTISFQYPDPAPNRHLSSPSTLTSTNTNSNTTSRTRTPRIPRLRIPARHEPRTYALMDPVSGLPGSYRVKQRTSTNHQTTSSSTELNGAGAPVRVYPGSWIGMARQAMHMHTESQDSGIGISGAYTSSSSKGTGSSRNVTSEPKSSFVSPRAIAARTGVNPTKKYGFNPLEHRTNLRAQNVNTYIAPPKAKAEPTPQSPRPSPSSNLSKSREGEQAPLQQHIQHIAQIGSTYTYNQHAHSTKSSSFSPSPNERLRVHVSGARPDSVSITPYICSTSRFVERDDSDREGDEDGSESEREGDETQHTDTSRLVLEGYLDGIFGLGDTYTIPTTPVGAERRVHVHEHVQGSGSGGMSARVAEVGNDYEGEGMSKVGFWGKMKMRMRVRWGRRGDGKVKGNGEAVGTKNTYGITGRFDMED